MAIVRREEAWNPFRELDELSARMNRLFGLPRFSGNGEQEILAPSDWSPSCDVTETDKEYRVVAELPNVKKDDVRVTFEAGTLSIEGERKQEKEEKGVKYHRRESVYGKFVRRFSMPDDADEAKVDANFKDGVLTVTVPKAKAKPKPQTIPIH